MHFPQCGWNDGFTFPLGWSSKFSESCNIFHILALRSLSQPCPFLHFILQQWWTSSSSVHRAAGFSLISALCTSWHLLWILLLHHLCPIFLERLNISTWKPSLFPSAKLGVSEMCSPVILLLLWGRASGMRLRTQFLCCIVSSVPLFCDVSWCLGPYHLVAI